MSVDSNPETDCENVTEIGIAVALVVEALVEESVTVGPPVAAKADEPVPMAATPRSMNATSAIAEKIRICVVVICVV
jgi:hypothetical protein